MGQWVYNASPEVDAASQYPTIIGVCVTLTSLMTIVVALRIYVRSILIKSLGLDDWIIVFSMVCSIIYNALGIVQSRYGLGLPLLLRPKINLNQYSVVNFTGRPFYMAGITGFKVALCFAYLRITTRSQSKKILSYRNVIWSMMAFAVLSHLGGTLVLIFQCHPIEKSWRPLTPGSCLPNDITFYVLAALTIISDVIIFVLPIPLLAKLRINTKKKIALIGVFALGLFTTICSVMRMIQIIQIAKDGNSTMLVLWGTVEMNVGITLTCLPTLTPLLTWFRERSHTPSVPYGYRYGYEKSGDGTNKRSSTLKPEIQLSRLSKHSIHGASGFHTTTTLGPAINRRNSSSSSQQTILGLSSVIGDGNIKAAEAGTITRTTEVMIHTEDMGHEGSGSSSS